MHSLTLLFRFISGYFNDVWIRNTELSTASDIPFAPPTSRIPRCHHISSFFPITISNVAMSMNAFALPLMIIIHTYTCALDVYVVYAFHGWQLRLVFVFCFHLVHLAVFYHFAYSLPLHPWKATQFIIISSILFAYRKHISFCACVCVCAFSSWDPKSFM